MRLNLLGKLRRLLQAADIAITQRSAPVPYFQPPAEAELAEWLRFFDELGSGDAAYRETHRERLARTMALVPPAPVGGRALELGCYMQMTPALALRLGYTEVRGAYYGPAGRHEWKEVRLPSGDTFGCRIDLFDAERDRFPYPDGWFHCVLACEILEHLREDPMHMLVEIRRVLAAGGPLVLTTPNCASLSSVVRVLLGRQNPQIFSCYPHPEGHSGESPHIREYTPYELVQLLEAAGFQIERLFTGRIGGYEEGAWAWQLLRDHGFDTGLRGEQIYCLARPRGEAQIDRYPRFLYEP